MTTCIHTEICANKTNKLHFLYLASYVSKGFFERANLTLSLNNIQTPPSFTIPQSGSRVDIPREAFIEYQDNILMIVAEGNVLRSFEKVYFLFFQTGYNGTQTLSRSAPAGIIYGGGNNCSTYLFV